MDTHECIKTRRSIRNFKPDPIPEAKLHRVLEAIQWAPSWVNYQPWEVIVVDHREVLAGLQDCIGSSNPGRKALSDAPCVLAVCGVLGKSGFYNGAQATVFGDWVMFDLGIACQNLCLAAWAEGLGSLHLGLLDHEKAASLLGLPENTKLYELIPIGFPAREPALPPRKKLSEFVHYNHFARKLDLKKIE